MVTDILRRSCECLSLIDVKQPAECLANHLPFDVMGISSHVGNLKQHGTDEMHCFQELQIYVHVEWHLSSPFQFFLHNRNPFLICEQA
jgi:hypothetical protein